jgi:tripartite-type tricarboxylate transporter receptor subunit TctC
MSLLNDRRIADVPVLKGGAVPASGQKRSSRTMHRLAASLIMLLTVTGAFLAQDYPLRPVMLVVPFPAGGGNDLLGRLVADKMSRSLGKQMVVENRGGAGVTVAKRGVARAAPVGYTLLLSFTGTLAIGPALYPNAGYDPHKDFAPIGPIASIPNVLIVHPSLPVRSAKELIDFAKANPGKINFAFVPASASHITTEMFMQTAGIELTNVAYRGNGNAMNDLLGGHVSMMFIPILPVISQIRSGTLRALAVTSASRSSLLPDVPTLAESVLPGFTVAINYGMVSPAGMPRPIIDRLNKDLREAVSADDLRTRLRNEGGETISGSPEDYAAIVESDEKKWGPLVKRLNLKVE